MTSYKVLGILKNIDKILIPTTIIVLSGVLLTLILVGYDKYSYNEGFYDGVNAFCKDKGILIVEGEYICLDDYNNIMGNEDDSVFNSEYSYEVIE